jgi:hypothetical protein
MICVRRAELSRLTGIAGLYPGADLADAYAVDLPSDTNLDAEGLTRLMLDRPPHWFRTLLRLRDLSVRAFGLKTTAALAAAGATEPGRHIGFFRVFDISADEIVLGEDDRHLDFRLSCRLFAAPDRAALSPSAGSTTTASTTIGSTTTGPILTVTTVVRCHNRLGRVYIALIAPFHRLVVRSLLQRLAARLADRQDAGQGR